MKKLNLYTGLHQWTLADLEHLSQADSEQAAALAFIFSSVTTIGKAVILGGCSGYVNPSNTAQWVFAPGYVAIAGEVYQFDGQTVALLDYTIGEYMPYFTVLETYRSDNPIVYGNGTPRNVHAIRKVTMAFQAPAAGIGPYTSTVPAGSFGFGNVNNPTNVVNAMAVLRARMAESVGAIGWQTVGVTVGAAAWVNGFDHSTYNTLPQQNVRYMKDLSEHVFIQGIISLEAIQTLAGANVLAMTAKQVFRMPVGLRPLLPVTRSFTTQTWDGYTTAVFTVNTDGWVTVVFINPHDSAIDNNSFDHTTTVQIELNYTTLL
jgi:hypothetical protein